MLLRNRMRYMQMCLLHIKHHIQICDDDRFVVKAGLEFVLLRGSKEKEKKQGEVPLPGHLCTCEEVGSVF